MVFFENTKRLAREFLSFKKYKQMTTPLAVFVGIFMCPFIIAFFVMLVLTFISAIFFTIVEAPIQFLHKLIKDETKEMHLAFRILIYYLSWPIVFGLYVSYAMMMIEIVIDYVLTQAVGYVASLGGFRFHISPLVERIDRDVDPEIKHNLAGIIHLVVCLVLAFIALVFVIVFIIIGAVTGDFESALLWVLIGMPFIGIIPLFEGIWACIAYRDRKKKAKEEKAEEAQPEQPTEAPAE